MGSVATNAIMETDWQLSVLPKSDKKPLAPSPMNIQTTSSGLMKDIIIDGTLMDENKNLYVSKKL